jgi:Asp-tRNA(Asn)/Glu-tRNA(Gln) amidotransferase A subunit family amidase
MPSDTGDGVDIVEATVAEVHAAFEAGALTAAALVDRYLDRIEAYDDELNAILTLNDTARSRAERLDEQFTADGLVGPLHGIPVILKDNADTHDMPTTAGSTALAESVPEEDAFVVDRLRAAGGVILAKANLQEFAFGVDTISSLGGATRNAYDLGRRPAGSSGGTAAAIAANLGAVGTGSDTCSSVRSPAAFNNSVGLRPTRGLISRSGIVPLCSTQDTVGPITRTVADTARMLDVLAGYDPADPVTATGADRIPAGGYTTHLDPDGLDGARIGVVREFFGRSSSESAPAAAAERVTATVEAALDAMAAAGATIVDPVEVVDADVLAAARVLEYEFARDFDAYLAGVDGDVPYDSLAGIVESGAVAPAVAERIRESDILEGDSDRLAENVGYLPRSRTRRRRSRPSRYPPTSRSRSCGVNSPPTPACRRSPFRPASPTTGSRSGSNCWGGRSRNRGLSNSRTPSSGRVTTAGRPNGSARLSRLRTGETLPPAPTGGDPPPLHRITGHRRRRRIRLRLQPSGVKSRYDSRASRRLSGVVTPY